MAEGALVYDVTGADFQQLVVEASQQRPVIVDFWAPWCGPCRMLGPVLDRIVESLDGKVALAKVNVDENPDLASQWRVQSIPTVKIMKDGQVAQQFVGAMPEPDVRKVINSVLPAETP